MSINLKELVSNIVETQRNSLLTNGYKQVKDFDQYYINEEGNIIRLKEDGGLSEVPMSLNKGGRYKVNLINSSNKQVTVIVHRALYQTFKGAIDSEIEFINGDPTDIRLTNLITTQELLDFYRKANNILPSGQEEAVPEVTAETETDADNKQEEAVPEVTAETETDADNKEEETVNTTADNEEIKASEDTADAATEKKEKKGTKKNNVRVIKGKKTDKAETDTKPETEKQKKEA